MDRTDWTQDQECWNHIDDLMLSMDAPLTTLLTSLHPHSQPTIQWLMLFRGFGAFVANYNNNRNFGNEPMASFQAAMASVAADPEIQAVMARFAADRFDGMVGV